MYSVIQVPVGVVLERVGSCRMIVAGAVLMAGGQLLMATAGSLPLGLAAARSRRLPFRVGSDDRRLPQPAGAVRFGAPNSHRTLDEECA